MKKIEWSLEQGKMQVNGNHVSLPNIVIKAVEINDLVLVLLDHSSMDRNIFALNQEGKIAWQIEAPSYGGNEPKPFTELAITSTGKVQAFNWNGFLHELDPTTGKTVSLKFTK